ncbi:hypothetical protein DFH11DRAFT_1644840 [Phellopilus nigrolimitatus]|nr:hypothetical protein DFH11DRAFT_1644840 [Phellopilus nigrolimitatus]
MRYGRLRTSFFALTRTTASRHIKLTCMSLSSPLLTAIWFLVRLEFIRQLRVLVACQFPRMCRRNGSPAPRKRDERPLNIASRRRMTGWCKQSVERLPSWQTQSKVLAVCKATMGWKRYPTRRRWSMQIRGSFAFRLSAFSSIAVSPQCVRGAHNSQLVTYPSQKLGLGLC